MGITEKNALKYFRQQNKVEDVMKKEGKDLILHGSRGLNVHTPKHLDKKPLLDFDYLNYFPKKRATEIETALDKSFGADIFEVVPSRVHRGTHKIRNKVTGETFVDVTRPNKKIPSTIIRGQKVVTLPYLEEKSKQVLDNPSAKFRHHKEKLVLLKLKLYKQWVRSHKRGKKKIRGYYRRGVKR